MISPLRRVREFSVGHYINRGAFWLLLGALGTVAYTLSDNVAASMIPAGPVSAARYGYLFFTGAAATYLLLTGLVGDSRRGSRADPAVSGTTAGSGSWCRVALPLALANYSAYWLVLWAYQLTDKLGYLVGFRQFGIVLGVIVGAGLFKEGGNRIRIPAACMIFVGLVVVKLWG